MYKDYFGLSDTPFSIAPNPHYLYMSDRHREALAHLLYGIRSDGGFILLTGEVGTGKTTVCRCLLEQIPEDVDTAFVLNPKLTAQELLGTICDDFKVEVPGQASIKVLVDRLNEFLLESHQKDRRTVVIIDEAQNLSTDVLEQLRLLTNLETNERKLLQIILLGQPELLDLLAKPELRQLSQRVTARFHLEPLKKAEVEEYIHHRLAVAGARGHLFSSSAINRIFRLSRGIPRLINLICDRALLGTYVQNQLQVDVPTINQAAREILGQKGPGLNQRLVAVAASLSILGFIGYLFLGNGDTESAPEPIAVIDANHQPTDSIQVPSTDVSQIQVEQKAIPNDHIIAAHDTSQQPAALDDDSGYTSAVISPVLDSMPSYNALESLTGFTDESAAFSELFGLWGNNVILAPGSDACVVATNSNLRCLTRLGSLREVLHLNRPVVISLQTGTEKFRFLISSITQEGIVLRANGKTHLLTEMDFLSAWDGYYTLLWRVPPAYDGPTMIGDRGITVDWLVSQITLTDNVQDTSETGNQFDQSLEARVKRFQISVGLVPDGVVGAQTWIHINSIEGTGIPFISEQGRNG